MKIRRILPLFIISVLVLTGLSAQSSRPMVEDITTVSFQDKVTVTWTLPSAASMADIKALNIYRSHQPFVSGNQLSRTTLAAVLSPDSTEYTDRDTSLFNWYYAVTAVYNDGNIYDIVIPTVNATVYPASSLRSGSDAGTETVPSTTSTETISTEESSIREKPLPYLQLFSSDQNQTDEISPETLAEAASFGINSIPVVQAEPYIFDDDRNENVTGDSYSLYYIIASCFERHDWKGSETELNRFLQTNKSSYITAKAQIYLGQAYYFQGKYREALRLFMVAEVTDPELSPLAKRWIQYSLDAFTLPDDAEHSD